MDDTRDRTPEWLRRHRDPERSLQAADRVAANMGLVHACIRHNLRIAPDDAWHDDAVSCLTDVLWQCALMFEPKLGVQFSTYAGKSLKRSCRRCREVIGRRGFSKVGRTAERPPEPYPLDRRDRNDNCPKDWVTAPASEDPYPLDTLAPLLDLLDDRTRAAVVGRYLECRTFRDLTSEFQVGREGVRQLVARGVGEMREVAEAA